MKRLKKMAVRSSLVLLGLLLGLLSVMIWNYFGFTTKQLQVTPPKKLTWNEEELIENFQGAIKIPTVSQTLSRIARILRSTDFENIWRRHIRSCIDHHSFDELAKNSETL